MRDIDVPGFIGNMDYPWGPASDGNFWFFDITSMSMLAEAFALSQICIRHNPERIVEYGTAMGGLTRCFGRWAFLTDAKVLSIDSSVSGYATMEDFPKHKALMEQLPIELLDMNEYNQECYDRVQDFTKDHKALFFTDGGNKPAEFRWCARILKPGDLLVTHDYGMTQKELDDVTLPGFWKETGHIREEQAQRVIDEFNLETVFDDELRGGVTTTRLLAVRLKNEVTENGSDCKTNAGSEQCDSKE